MNVTREDLRELYLTELEKISQAAKEGPIFLEYRGYSGGIEADHFYVREEDGEEPSELKRVIDRIHRRSEGRTDFNRQIRPLRQEVMSEMLFERLTGFESATLANIFDTVSDPVLDRAILFMQEPGWESRKHELETGNTNKNYNMQAGFYMRAMVLLELLDQHPEIEVDLKQNSSYFPHRLFVEVSQKVNEGKATLDAIASVYPDHLDEVIKEMGYAISGDKTCQNCQGRSHSNDCGRFRVPHKTHAYFNCQTDSSRFEEILADKEVRNELLDTCAQTLVILRDAKGRRIKADQKLNLTKVGYETLWRTVGNHARNKLLGFWKKYGRVRPMPLVKSINMGAEADEDRLRIYWDKGEERLFPVSRFFPVDSSIPYCMYTLRRLMDKHEEISE